MLIRRLTIISKEYPTPTRSVYPFVDHLACALADIHVEVSVVSPFSITKSVVRGAEMPPLEYERVTKRGNVVHVYRPRYASLSDSIFGINTAMLTYKGFRRAAIAEIRRRKLMPDAIYGHFIAMGGLCASEIGEMLGVPAFLGYGESSPKNFAMFDTGFVRERLNALRGIVSVSTENKRQLLELGFVEDERKIRVFPNGIDLERFRAIDRTAARETLGFPKDAFIVSFVGAFIERKGISVLSEALSMLPDVYAIFVGQGTERPACDRILFQGPVLNEQVPLYLSASDVFALPTRNEGCCNAIIEAMGCALPVISSDIPCNADILNAENAILIDPMSAKAIADAIAKLRDDPRYRARLSNGALDTARGLGIEARAENILNYIREE